MKFQCVNEMNQICLDDSKILEFSFSGGRMRFVFNGAVIQAKNSQNGRYQDMFCGELELSLEDARIARFMKEGMKYYDANGTLLREIPDEDVPAPAQETVLKRLSGGTVFTVVEDKVENGYAYEFGIDVPKEEDEEEVDTYWLCILFDKSTAGWERYQSPVNE